MLSLDVKNKHSILNSLALYTDGELLEGDNKASCSRCNPQDGDRQASLCEDAASSSHSPSQTLRVRLG